MRRLFGNLDRLLRGEDQASGTQAGAIQVADLVRAALVTGVIYGVFMGLYAGTRTEAPTWAQVALSAIKVPLLFLLTLVVTFPSLYVFSALANSPLRGADTLRLLLAAITVNLALLASFGPVTGFFTMSTDSYPFMVLLNVVFFGISGFVGLGFLTRRLGRVFERPDRDTSVWATTPAPMPGSPAPPPPPLPAEPAPASDRLSTVGGVPVVSERVIRARPFERMDDESAGARRVFRIWVLIYGVVGVQMAWILRPFIGTPTQDLTLFRPRGSNFFEAVAATIHRLFE